MTSNTFNSIIILVISLLLLSHFISKVTSPLSVWQRLVKNLFHLISIMMRWIYSWRSLVNRRQWQRSISIYQQRFVNSFQRSRRRRFLIRVIYILLINRRILLLSRCHMWNQIAHWHYWRLGRLNCLVLSTGIRIIIKDIIGMRLRLIIYISMFGVCIILILWYNFHWIWLISRIWWSIFILIWCRWHWMMQIFFILFINSLRQPLI